MTSTLGKLEALDLRSIWSDETIDFTPWLAEEENIKSLGEGLGIELELVGVESDVGPYSADVVCRDTADGSHVVIENQLEKTDHTHLGQLLTYAAGFERGHTLIWIAKEFTDEHRAAIDMLNRISVDEFRIFGIEIEVWRIGESVPAPRFNIVVEPNDWTKGDNQSVSELTATQRRQLDFWIGFTDYVEKNGKPLNLRKPRAQHWTSIGIGKTGFNISAVASTWDSETNVASSGELRVELVMNDRRHSKKHFELLRFQEAEIESEIYDEVLWLNSPNNLSCKIAVKAHSDLGDEDMRAEQYSWFQDRILLFQNVFIDRVKSLEVDT